MNTHEDPSVPTPEYDQLPSRLPVDFLSDGGCRNIDPDHVKRLREHVDDLPPVTVDPYSLKVIDGSHRLEAIRSVRSGIDVVYRTTTDEVDLIRQAVKINEATDRRPLSPDDRREAIRHVLEADPSISNRALAKACQLPESTTRLHRRRLVEAGEVANSPTRRGRDGKSYPANRPVASNRTLGARIAALLRRLGQLVRAAFPPVR